MKYLLLKNENTASILKGSGTNLFESKWDRNIPGYLFSLNTRFDVEKLGK